MYVRAYLVSKRRCTRAVAHLFIPALELRVIVVKAADCRLLMTGIYIFIEGWPVTWRDKWL